MSDRLQPPGVPRWWWVLFALILLVGGGLRAWRPGLNVFDHDGAWLVLAAFEAAQDPGSTHLGQPSTLGPRNSPLSLYLLAPLFVDEPSPRAGFAAVACLSLLAVLFVGLALRRHAPRAALWAAAWLAVSPLAIIEARTLWLQALLPGAAAGLTWAATAWAGDRRSGALAAVLPLAVLLPQLHWVGLVLVGGVAILALIRRAPLRLYPALVGLVLAFPLLIPLVAQEWATGGETLRQLQQVTVGGRGLPPLGALALRALVGVALATWVARKWRHRHRPGVGVAAGWLAVASALLLVLAPIPFIRRSWLPLLEPVVALAAATWLANRGVAGRVLRGTLALALLGGSLYLLFVELPGAHRTHLADKEAAARYIVAENRGAPRLLDRLQRKAGLKVTTDVMLLVTRAMSPPGHPAPGPPDGRRRYLIVIGDLGADPPVGEVKQHFLPPGYRVVDERTFNRITVLVLEPAPVDRG